MSRALFTYGTLMFPEVWRVVVGPDHSGKDFKTTPATLPGYQIFRVKDAHYPGIIKTNPSPSERGQVRVTSGPPPSTVSGLVYHNLDLASLARLDAFEGEFYVRETITAITTDGHELAADAYIVPPDAAHLLTDEIWTAESFAARGHLADFVARYTGFRRL